MTNIPDLEPVTKGVFTPTRLQPGPFIEPADEIVAEAREICAALHEADPSPIMQRCAPHYRNGHYDEDREMRLAQAALRRGIKIGKGAES